MRDVFIPIIENFTFTGELKTDVINFLINHDRNRIAEHTARVARKARSLAKIFGIDENKAEVAGLMHDIGGIYPNDKRIEISSMLNLEILKEEQQLPMILHQKLSTIIAQEIFQVNNSDILDAIRCHTTLRADAKTLDMVLFIADKLEWDQPGVPEYYDVVEKAVGESIELAAYVYIKYLFEEKDRLKVVHPWLLEAYKDLGRKLARGDSL